MTQTVTPAVSTDFDLLAESWIPVLDRAGAPQEVGLIECLSRAHELREVADASPLVTYGVYRFLAAVLQTYLRLPDEDAWVDVWEHDRFDAGFLDKVLSECTGRLRLFDPDHPFYQSGDVPLPAPGARRPSGDPKTVGYLFPEASTGTNIVHFSHPGDGDHALCPACCARGLVALSPFATSGGAGIKPSLNGVPPIYVLPGSRSLFEALLLNYVLPRFQPSLAAPDDPGPRWARDGIVATRSEQSQVGFVESLTWAPRRVRLFPSAGGRCSRCRHTVPVLVRQMLFAQGVSRPKSLPAWYDPWVAYRRKRDTGAGGQAERVAIRPQAGKDVWRDFSALFLAEEGRQTGGQTPTATRPAILQQIDTLLGRYTGLFGGVDVPLRFEVFALRTDGKMKFFEWRQECFDFPPAVLQGTADAPVEEAIRRADGAAWCLARALRRLHPVAQRPSADQKAVKAALAGTIARVLRAYWQDLELRFRQLIGDPRLTAGMTEQARWDEDWRRIVWQAAAGIFEATIDGGGFEADAAALRRQEGARGAFYRSLSRALRSGLGADAGPGADGAAEGTEEDEPEAQNDGD